MADIEGWLLCLVLGQGYRRCQLTKAFVQNSPLQAAHSLNMSLFVSMVNITAFLDSAFFSLPFLPKYSD